MDPIKNPFAPGAGSPPPQLVGRNQLIEEMRVLLARIKAQRPERSMLFTGLRGVGKTVLLNKFEQLAEEAGYHTCLLEAHENKSLGALLTLPLRKLLFSLDRFAKLGDKAKRALAVLKGFASAVTLKVGQIEFGLDIELEQGTADSGDIEEDLPNVFLAIAEAAKEHNTVVAILMDELQYLSMTEISALIMAMHKIQQRQLPLVFVAAGLPILPALAGESKSYTERLFKFPSIGPLSEEEATKALQDPVADSGVHFTAEAMAEIFRLTEGYPSFLQEWGYYAWNHSESSIIDLALIKKATQDVIQRLDENFFGVRLDRLTPNEKTYLRAIAELGPGPQRSSIVPKVNALPFF